MGSERQAPYVSPTSRRLTGGRRLAEARFYRPGPLLAAAILLSPALLALIGGIVSLAVWGSIPVLLPLLLLLWIPVLPTTWLIMTSVRTTPVGIAISRPWRQWREIPWDLIERAERTGRRIVVHASDGRQIGFSLLTLRDGTRLHREILMRLPMHVLDARLRGDARDVLGEPVVPRPDGGLSGGLQASPRPVWRWAALAAVAASALVAVVAALLLPPLFGIPVAVLGLIGVAAGVVTFTWFRQELVISETGIAVIGALTRKMREIAWSEIQLIEYTPRERVLRLRGDRRLRCPGPTVLLPSERDVMRAFLHEYCIGRGVPVVERRWLW